jgi:long-chain fatty acid transport protein
MLMMKRLTQLMALVTLFLLVSTALATNGTRMVGFNALSVGRGGTGTGVFDSPALMMTNPAGISFLHGSMLDGDFSLMVPALKFTNSINTETRGETNYFPIISLGYVNHEKGREWTWGLGAFTQGGMGADFTLKHDLFRDLNGSFIPQQYHSKLAVMQGGASLAYQFSPQFAVGATAHLVYSMLEFQMPYSLAPSVMEGVINPQTGMTFGDLFAGSPAQGGFGYSEVTAAAKMDGLGGFGFCGKLGLAFRVSDNVTMGVTYSSPTAVTYKSGNANMDMTAQLNDAFGKAVQGYIFQNPGSTSQQAQQAVMQQFLQLGIDLSAGVVAQYDLEAKLTFPQSFGFGMMVDATPELRFALDAEWVNWKNAFDVMTLDLTNGNNANINRMLGNDGAFNIDFPMNWKDSYNLRVGAEFAANSAVTLRAGYAFGSNPVTEKTVFPVFPAIVENHVMFGASYRVADPVQLHFAYEIAMNKKQTASNQSTIAQEFNNSVSQLAENIFHLSFSWALQ